MHSESAYLNPLRTLTISAVAISRFGGRDKAKNVNFPAERKKLKIKVTLFRIPLNPHFRAVVIQSSHCIGRHYHASRSVFFIKRGM